MAGGITSTACALIIGNELLNGSTNDCNLGELARTLRGLGIRLKRAVFLPDELDTLVPQIRAASAEYDVVFTSGGVGPTHDDLTISAVAQAFGVSTVVSDEMRQSLVSYYGDPLTPAQLQLAVVPDGACMMRLPDNVWPTIVMHNVWVLPGVPAIFRAKLEAVRHFLRGPVTYHSRAVFCRSDELTLKPLIDETVSSNPQVEIGSYPLWPATDAQTKITFECTDQTLIERAVEQFVSGLAHDDLLKLVE